MTTSSKAIQERVRKTSRTKARKKKIRVKEWITKNSAVSSADVAKKFDITVSAVNQYRSELIAEGKIERKSPSPGKKSNMRRKKGPAPKDQPGELTNGRQDLTHASIDLQADQFELPPELLDMVQQMFGQSTSTSPEIEAVRVLQDRNNTTLAHFIELHIQTLEQNAKEDALHRDHEIQRMRLLGSLQQATSKV